jgi:ribosome-interacting GTPase 1
MTTEEYKLLEKNKQLEQEIQRLNGLVAQLREQLAKQNRRSWHEHHDRLDYEDDRR